MLGERKDASGFTSARLSAVPAVPELAVPLARALSDPVVHRWTTARAPDADHLARQFAFVSSLPGGRSPDGAEIWLTWIVLLRDSDPPGTPIGYVQSTIHEPNWVKIAYVLGLDYWRKGYAREAITAMLDFVFERYEVHAAIAEIDPRNEGSLRFAEALGLRYRETLIASSTLNGENVDDHLYEISRTDWLAGRIGTAE